MSLEKDLQKLQQLANVVEDENTPLEESLKAFEESVTLAEKCLKELSSCRGKFVVLQNKIQELKDGDKV